MRLLKRDVPQQPTDDKKSSSSSPPPSSAGESRYTPENSTSTEISSSRIDIRHEPVEIVPALPPKQSKYSSSDTAVSGGERTTPALPPRIDGDIEVNG